MTKPDLTEFYALTQAEGVGVAERMGYTKTESWLVGEQYANTKAAGELLELIRQFRMTPELWRHKVTAQKWYVALITQMARPLPDHFARYDS